MDFNRPFVRGGEGFRRLYPDGRVPLSRRKHDHLIQELIDTGQQVLSVLGLIRNVMKDLNADGEGQGIQVWKRPVKACGVIRQRTVISDLRMNKWGSVRSYTHYDGKNTAQYSGITAPMKQCGSDHPQNLWRGTEMQLINKIWTQCSISSHTVQLSGFMNIQQYVW